MYLQFLYFPIGWTFLLNFRSFKDVFDVTSIFLCFILHFRLKHILFFNRKGDFYTLRWIIFFYIVPVEIILCLSCFYR